jgi:hypothetical protein
LRSQDVSYAGERHFKISVYIVRQGFERRDVDDLGFILKTTVKSLPHQRVNGRQERSEGFARPRRRRDQHISSGFDRGPSVSLRLRWRGEMLFEPGGDRWMKIFKLHWENRALRLFGLFVS